MHKLLLLTFSLLIYSNIFGQFEFFEPKTTIGGYGELHYNYKNQKNSDPSKTLDFHRFVIFLGHSFSEKWSFKSEIELEHNFVKDGQGEFKLEQAYVNYHHSIHLGFQAGVILNSVGLINEFHEPPLFLSVERSEYDKYIIPTTWFGNGFSVYGLFNGLRYKINIMEGLNSDKFSMKSGIRDARQNGFKSNVNSLLYNINVDYLNISGLKFGTSFTYNNAEGDSTEIPINIIEFHAQYQAHNIIANGEFGIINYFEGDLEASRGYYADLGYNLGRLFFWELDFIPFVRYTNYNTAASTKTGGDNESKYHTTKWMIGLTILPIQNIVFKLDYSNSRIEFNDQNIAYFNIGVGYMF